MSAQRWHYVNRYTPNCGAGKVGIAWTITDRPARWGAGGMEAVDGSDLVCIADTRDVKDESVARLIAAAPALAEALRALVNRCVVDSIFTIPQNAPELDAAKETLRLLSARHPAGGGS